MLVGTGDASNGGGNAMLYTSEDKTSWEKEGFILEYSYEQNTEVGHVWELPVLLPVRNESNQVAFHVLLLCACQTESNIVHTYYWKGDWDATERKFTKHHEKALLLDLGAGVFTGPSGFVTPDNRSVVFTIAQGKRNHEDEFQSGWAHNGGLPVELHACGGKLGVRPIREVYQLRTELLLEEYDIEVDEINRRLAQIVSSKLYVKVESNCDSIGIVVNRSEGVDEVFYDRVEKHFGVRTEARLGENKLVSVRRDENDFVDIGDQPINMEYFLDNSMIEVYLNELKAISHRNYTEANDRTLHIVSNDDRMLVQHIQVWAMNDVYL
jgi:sucrose-6-phosphate hydrolase SacC (GH32 family)